MNYLKKINSRRIILGSQSPRRHMLLKGLGINFEVMVNENQDETYPAGLTEYEIPVYLARKKSQAFKKLPDENTILITADTIVWIDSEVLGKPVDREDASNILHKLSGNKHEVLTGVCIRSSENETAFCVKSDVYFRHLLPEEIAYYVDNYQPYDKAGAYGVQEWIGYIGIEKIDGSYFNVMGLPTQRLFLELQKFVNE
ncbi:MAG: Maf family nucleotide pyrophosphatase [Bacteroidales bacterium]